MNRDTEVALLASITAHNAELEQLLRKVSSHWGFEDPIYRFYHQSFKVYSLQASTNEMVRLLTQLAPQPPLNSIFLDIVAQGTGRTFTMADNARWAGATRPILEAFFHARYFVEMAVRYADLPEPPSPLPSGYAALLYLFNLR